MATTRMQSSARPWPGADLIVLGTARYGSATRLTEDAVVQKLSTTRQLH